MQSYAQRSRNGEASVRYPGRGRRSTRRSDVSSQVGNFLVLRALAGRAPHPPPRARPLQRQGPRVLAHEVAAADAAPKCVRNAVHRRLTQALLGVGFEVEQPPDGVTPAALQHHARRLTGSPASDTDLRRRRGPDGRRRERVAQPARRDVEALWRRGDRVLNVLGGAPRQQVRLAAASVGGSLASGRSGRHSA